MKFEYDTNKSLSNKKKHGIDFEEIKELWKDERMVEILTPFEDEVRYISIGKIKEKFYSVITTMRGDRIRIISARRSRKKEIEIYESKRV